jgi:hypothetical protein
MEDDDGDRCDIGNRLRLREILLDLERSAAAELGGDATTAQVREYVEHHEFGLALELLVSILMREGAGPDGYRERIERAAARMDVSDSDHLRAWRRYGEA